MSRRLLSLIAAITAAICLMSASAQQRRVTPAPPVIPGSLPSTPKTETNRPVNPDRLARYHDENGNTVLVDTITGKEWIDSTAIKNAPKMKYPLVHSVSLGVDLWDAAMRIFGQKYGLGGVTAQFSMHNRYIAVFDFGLGQCSDTPSGSNFTFKSPVAPYFRIGGDYNVFYNNSPDYQLRAGLRYGMSAFKWSVDNITTDDGYWGEPSHFSMPSRTTVAGWLEVLLSIKVKIAGPISAGWAFKFHKVLHQSNTADGKPMVIPGAGKPRQAVTGAFTIYYTLELNKKRVPDVINSEE